MEHTIYTCKQTTGSNVVASLVFKDEGIPSGMASEPSQSDIVLLVPAIVGLIAYYFNFLAARISSGFLKLTKQVTFTNIFAIDDIKSFEEYVFGTPVIAFRIPKLSDENRMILETFGYRLKGNGRNSYWFGPAPTIKVLSQVLLRDRLLPVL